jgi:putative inorganic carbon (HCO3(-)) transporter
LHIETQNSVDRFHPGLVAGLLAGYVFLLPVQFRTSFGLRIAPSDLMLALYLLATIGRLRFRRSAWSVWHAGLAVVLFGGMLNVALTTGTVSTYALLNKGIGFLLLLASYSAIAFYARDWQRLRWILRVFVFAVVVHAVVGLAGFVATIATGFRAPWLNSYSSRLSGMLIDPNAFGGVLVMAFAIHLAASYGSKPLITGWFGTLATAILPIGILLTYSRSAWLGLAAVLIVGSFFRPRMLLRIAGLGVLAVLAAVSLLGAQYLTVMAAMAARPQQIEARFELASLAFEVFQEHPVLGVGIGGFWQMTGAGTHNTLLWFLTDFGLVGLTVFIGFFSWFVFKAYVSRRLASSEEKSLVLGLGLAHFAMLGLSFGIEALYQRHWWLVMALIAASYSIARRESPAAAATGDPTMLIEPGMA